MQRQDQSEDDALACAQKAALKALAELRTLRLTPEEEEVLAGFDAFRREHPFQISSLVEEE